LGAGTLILTGGDIYAATTISAGVLQIGNGGAGCEGRSGTHHRLHLADFQPQRLFTVAANITAMVRSQQTAPVCCFSPPAQLYRRHVYHGGTLSTSTSTGTSSVSFNGGVYQFQPSTSFDLGAHALHRRLGGASTPTETTSPSAPPSAVLGNSPSSAPARSPHKTSTYIGGTSVQGGKLITNTNFSNGQLPSVHPALDRWRVGNISKLRRRPQPLSRR